MNGRGEPMIVTDGENNCFDGVDEQMLDGESFMF
jgi:hypothetical protein